MFKIICNILKSLESVLNLSFFRQQGSRDRLQGMISCRIVSTVNGVIFSVLMTPAEQNFD